jgi:hypothetical protein
MSADARRRAEARRIPTPLGELARGEAELEQRLDSLVGLEYVLLRFAVLKRGDAVQASYGRLPAERLERLERLAGERGLRGLRDALADTAAQIDGYLELDPEDRGCA